jgi:hypothetical protein
MLSIACLEMRSMPLEVCCITKLSFPILFILRGIKNRFIEKATSTTPNMSESSGIMENKPTSSPNTISGLKAQNIKHTPIRAVSSVPIKYMNFVLKSIFIFFFSVFFADAFIILLYILL